MTRNIICLYCLPKLQKTYGIEREGEPFPGEFVRFETGKARRVYSCDQCNRTIPATALCAAMSIWTGVVPYFEWEDEFIEKKEDQCQQ